MASLFRSVTLVLRPPLRPIDRMLDPVRIFMRHRLAGAALLMLTTLAAIVIANSDLAESYHNLLHSRIEFHTSLIDLDYTLHHWINDGLMSVFFFLVGLEIKRELLVGELSTVRKATLPAIAAVGGMVVPALFYILVNRSAETGHGWGIPMATDIAFALGVLALLGDRVPLGVKVFLTALAIVDDIGAVLVIALFYTTDLNWLALTIGMFCLLLAVALNNLEARSPLMYLVVGIVMWIAFLKSGVHATIAAILMAFTIPASTRLHGQDFIDRMRFVGAKLERVGVPSDTRLNTEEQQHALTAMGELIEHAQAPLQRIEHTLHNFVTFIILPVFAFANAGVTLGGELGVAVGSPLALGIILGLFLGKQLGITLATWLAVKLGLADMPRGVTWQHIHGASILGGIGFTMSLFIAGLAFKDPAFVEIAKVGILAASILSGVVGYLFLSQATKVRLTSPAQSP